MKRITTIIMLFYFGVNSHAQNYIPLIQQDNTWYLLAENATYFKKNAVIDTMHQMDIECLKSSIVQYKKTYITKLSSDTMIGDLKYTKVLTSYDSLSSIWSYMGLVREDTLKQIVYFKDSNFDEQILYSFNVKVNDTIGFMVVKYVDTVLINNKPRKRIGLSWGRTWIEGIGGLSGLLTSTFDMPMCGPKLTLLCLTNKDSIKYKLDNSNYKDCFYWGAVTGINTINNSQLFEFYPNPAGDYINIKSNIQGFYNIKILDLQGRLLIHQKIQNSDGRIDLAGIKSGVLLINISNDNEYSITKMIKK